jgi:amino acid transporter
MIAKGKRIGLRTLQDGIGVLMLLLLPLEISSLVAINEKLTAYAAFGTYLLSVAYYFTLFLSHKDERTEIEWKNAWMIATYPLFWLAVSFVAWWKALLTFRRKVAGKDYEPGIFIKTPKHDWQPEYSPSDI